MSRQYIACAFSAAERTYTYHNDGPPLAVGDECQVETKGGGKATLTVRTILASKPHFDTKPIIGRAPVEAAKE